MFLPKSRQLSAIGKEGIYIEDQDDRFSLHSDRYSPSFYHFKPTKTVLGPGSIYKESRPESPYFKAGNSYTGFHRPLRVVPPSATPTARNTTPPAPPPYSTRTPYFPSHFFPEKLYQYWQYYYPRAPGFYARPDLESLNIYTSLYEQDRTKSANPNVYFYKTKNNLPPGFIY